MTYQLIEDYTCYFTGGPLNAKGWAIHHWGDPAQNPTFAGILQVLLTRSAQESASVNFMAEANKVACLVDPFTIAWGQGDGYYGWGNNNLVSLECNPRCTAEDRETVAELIADQHIRNGIPIVLYPHKKFTSTACPGRWEEWIPWLTERAKQIVAEKTSSTAPVVPQSAPPAPTPAPAPVNTGNNGHNPDTEIHWVVESGDTLSKIASYYYGADAYANINKLAAYNGIGNPNGLSVGQNIFIPGEIVWIIEAPDTLETIAAYYGMDADALAHNNGLPNRWAEIYIGNTLTIIP